MSETRKLTVRLDEALHAAAMDHASKSGQTLNGFIADAVADTIGLRAVSQSGHGGGGSVVAPCHQSGGTPATTSLERIAVNLEKLVEILGTSVALCTVPSTVHGCSTFGTYLSGYSPGSSRATDHGVPAPEVEAAAERIASAWPAFRVNGHARRSGPDQVERALHEVLSAHDVSLSELEDLAVAAGRTAPQKTAHRWLADGLWRLKPAAAPVDVGVLRTRMEKARRLARDSMGAVVDHDAEATYQALKAEYDALRAK